MISTVQTKRTIKLAGQATALTIAGSDPSGGAGLQADLKTFQQMGVYGMSVVTLLTVQNTQLVERVMVLEPEFVRDQLKSVLDDIPPIAIKLGALGNSKVIQTVAEELFEFETPLVVDPVMVSKHGHTLLDDEAIDVYRQMILPQSFLITPNRKEAEKLAGFSINSLGEAQDAVAKLIELGCRNVLLKHGKVGSDYQVCLGLEDSLSRFATPYLETNSTHGSGCVLAASITALLSLGWTDLKSIAEFALQEVSTAISVGTRFGRGISPVETRVISNPLVDQT